MRLRDKGGRKCEKAQTATTPLSRLRDSWLEDTAVRGYAPSTVNSNKWALEPFMLWSLSQGFGHPELVSIEALHTYQRWLHDRRKRDGSSHSAATRRTCIGALKCFFQWLYERGEITANPAAKLHLPKRPSRTLPHTLNRKEVQCLFAQPNFLDPLGLRDRAILELLYASGIRRSELVNLNIEDIELDCASIRIR